MASRRMAHVFAGETLGTKVRALEKLMKMPVNHVYECPVGEHGYRMKTSLRVTEVGGQGASTRRKFAMNNPVDRHTVILEDAFVPIMHENINNALPLVEEAIQGNSAIAQELFEVKLQYTLQGELGITMLYRKPIVDEIWRERACELAENITNLFPVINYTTVLGRARRQVVRTGNEYLQETLHVALPEGGQGKYHFRQHLETFSQPNAYVNQLMLEWAIGAGSRERGDSPYSDLLELYCGNGNFTVPLATECFRRALATEVDRNSVRDAEWALHMNKLEHSVDVVRMSAAEVTEALFGERHFHRLRDIYLEDLGFHTIFVDPPRAGLDQASIRLLSHHVGQIIYVSCNPLTLKRDLDMLRESSEHEVIVRDLVCFDQFPLTDHIECGLDLEMVRR